MPLGYHDEASRQSKKNSRAVEVIDYISLRARGAEHACQSRGEVTLCTHHYALPNAYNSHSMDDEAKRSRSFAVGIKRYLGEEDNAELREMLEDERTIRISAQKQYEQSRSRSRTSQRHRRHVDAAPAAATTIIVAVTVIAAATAVAAATTTTTTTTTTTAAAPSTLFQLMQDDLSR